MASPSPYEDCATHVPGRMATSAAGELVLAALVAGLGAGVAAKLDVLGPARFLAVALFAWVVWRLVADAVRKLREATDPRCHLRAGPAGVSIRHPVGSRLLGFDYRLLELEIPWSEIRRKHRQIRTNHIALQAVLYRAGLERAVLLDKYPPAIYPGYCRR